MQSDDNERRSPSSPSTPPRSPKDTQIPFTDKSLRKLFEIKKSSDQIDMLKSIARGEGYSDSSKKGTCYVEFMFSNLHFVKEKKLQDSTALVFMKSMNASFVHAVKTMFKETNESFRVFKNEVLKYCKYSTITISEASLMTDFATKSFFRVFHLHYRTFSE